jgi:hypothetical protein
LGWWHWLHQLLPLLGCLQQLVLLSLAHSLVLLGLKPSSTECGWGPCSVCCRWKAWLLCCLLSAAGAVEACDCGLNLQLWCWWDCLLRVLLLLGSVSLQLLLPLLLQPRPELLPLPLLLPLPSGLLLPGLPSLLPTLLPLLSQQQWPLLLWSAQHVLLQLELA